jgi:hypothetical protein
MVMVIVTLLVGVIIGGGAGKLKKIPFRARFGRSAAGVEFRANVRFWVCPYLPIGDRLGSIPAGRRIAD